PMVLPEPFRLAAVLPREDPRDAFVSNRHPDLESLPDGAIVGTSSLRRSAQLRARRPRLEVRPLRGNVNTRLGKLDAGEFDAILLAAAGLKRLGLVERIRQVVPPTECLPAAGPGALGIEIRAGRRALARWLAPPADAGPPAPGTGARPAARAPGARLRGAPA